MTTIACHVSREFLPNIFAVVTLTRHIIEKYLEAKQQVERIQTDMFADLYAVSCWNYEVTYYEDYFAPGGEKLRVGEWTEVDEQDFRGLLRTDAETIVIKPGGILWQGYEKHVGEQFETYELSYSTLENYLLTEIANEPA